MMIVNLAEREESADATSTALAEVSGLALVDLWS